jgi:hypothetical protein
MVRDDSKLLDDSGEVSKSNRGVSISIFSCEILFVLDRKIGHVVFQKKKRIKKNIVAT